MLGQLNPVQQEAFSRTNIGTAPTLNAVHGSVLVSFLEHAFFSKIAMVTGIR